MAINSKSDYKDLAYDFIEILTSQAVQQDLIEKSQGVSVLKRVMNNQKTKQILQDNNENDLKTKLSKLNALKMEGIISEEEYAEKRKKIIDESI